MIEQTFFDVLKLKTISENVDIIQSLIGEECLGSQINNDSSILYFN